MPSLSADRAPSAAGVQPLTDSPWFWMIVFGFAALVGGTLIAPKFRQRMGRVERMHDTRTQLYIERQWGVGDKLPEPDAAKPELSKTVTKNMVNIDTLLIFVAVILIGGGACGRWWEGRRPRAALAEGLAANSSPPA